MKLSDRNYVSAMGVVSSVGSKAHSVRDARTAPYLQGADASYSRQFGGNSHARSTGLSSRWPTRARGKARNKGKIASHGSKTVIYAALASYTLIAILKLTAAWFTVSGPLMPLFKGLLRSA